MTTDIDLLKQATDLLEHGNSVALCTIIEKKGSGPREVGAKMIVSKNGKTIGTIGGGNLERAIIAESLKILSTGNKTKVTSLTERLKATGFTDENLLVLDASIGLDINAQSPEEIGISILAEIIREGKRGKPSTGHSSHSLR